MPARVRVDFVDAETNCTGNFCRLRKQFCASLARARFHTASVCEAATSAISGIWSSSVRPEACAERAAASSFSLKPRTDKSAAFGSQASCTMISDTSTWSRKPCNPSTTRSARGCHPCLRYDLLPMSPGWTNILVAEGEELGSNLLHVGERD
jgi:hypothetical protein